MDAGAAAVRAQDLIERALDDGPRDLNRAEAAQLREAGAALLCAALEAERIVLEIPAPIATRG